jgi:short-subunit dehydrogenase
MQTDSLTVGSTSCWSRGTRIALKQSPGASEAGPESPARCSDVAKDLGRVGERLRQDALIGLLVNNAGALASGGFADPDLDVQEQLIRLNVTAVTRLAGAAIPRFLPAGRGSIINVASVLALAPEIVPGIYAATKAFVLNFSQSLQAELGPRGPYVQAVLPAATRTELWARSGRDDDAIPGVMEVGELVDAALLGFDRRETITMPWLPDVVQWENFATARHAMVLNSRQEHPPHGIAREVGQSAKPQETPMHPLCKCEKPVHRRPSGWPACLPRTTYSIGRRNSADRGSRRYRSVAETSGVQTTKLKGDINMRAVQLTAFGNPVDGLEYVDSPEPEAPGPNQVLIGVEFSPINPNDLMVAQGIYAYRPPLPTVIGNEGVGRVLAVGPGVESVKVGDRVLAPISSFTWRERMVIPANGLSTLP